MMHLGFISRISLELIFEINIVRKMYNCEPSASEKYSDIMC